jgi:hypothetical protein
MCPQAAAAPVSPDKPKAGADDIPGDLPPLDGDDEEREADAEKLADDELPHDDGGDPFDDATGEGEPVPELDDEGGRDASLLDAAPADDLEIGAADTLGSETDRFTDDGREEPLAGEYDLPDEDGGTDRDPGDEGPTTDDESLTDDGLPPLDQDDDGAEGEASAFFDEGFDSDSAGGWLLPWERFGPPLDVPAARAISRFRDGVVVGGRDLLRVGLEGGVERALGRGLRGGDITRVFVVEGDLGEQLFVTTESGGLFVSRDRGALFVEVSGWRERVRPEEAASGLEVVVTARDGLWGRSAQGSLLWSRDPGGAWETVQDIDGFAQALCTDDRGGVVVVLRALAETEVLRRGAGGIRRLGVPVEMAPAGLDRPMTVAACGAAIAIGVEGEGVIFTRDGRTWRRVTGTERVTAFALLDDAGTLAVAVDSDEAGARSSLLRVSPSGEQTVVATWQDRPPSEPGVTALAVDASHQVVWVAGGFGVAAFQPKMVPGT